MLAQKFVVRECVVLPAVLQDACNHESLPKIVWCIVHGVGGNDVRCNHSVYIQTGIEGTPLNAWGGWGA